MKRNLCFPRMVQSVETRIGRLFKILNRLRDEKNLNIRESDLETRCQYFYRQFRLLDLLIFGKKQFSVCDCLKT